MYESVNTVLDDDHVAQIISRCRGFVYSPCPRAVFLPASYTSFGGWVSILTYATATGLPLLLAAEWGAIILRSCPDVRSLHRSYIYTRIHVHTYIPIAERNGCGSWSTKNDTG